MEQPLKKKTRPFRYHMLQHIRFKKIYPYYPALLLSQLSSILQLSPDQSQSESILTEKMRVPQHMQSALKQFGQKNKCIELLESNEIRQVRPFIYEDWEKEINELNCNKVLNLYDELDAFLPNKSTVDKVESPDFNDEENEVKLSDMIPTRENHPNLPLVHLNETIACSIYRNMLNSNVLLSNLEIAKMLAIPLRLVRRPLKMFTDCNLVVSEKEDFNLTKILKYKPFLDSKNAKIVSKLCSQTTPVKTVSLREARAEMIVNILKNNNGVMTRLEIYRNALREEAENGSQLTMDRKSLMRVLDDLIRQNLIIKLDTITFLRQKIPNLLDLYALSGVKTQDPEFISLCNRLVNVSKFMDVTSHVLGPAFFKMQDEFSEIERLNISKDDLVFLIQSEKFNPKFRKRQVLHQYLWYAVHGLDPRAKPVVNEEVDVYFDDLSWKRYVYPIKNDKGWCDFFDIVRQMPLGLFIWLSSRFYVPLALFHWLGTVSLDPDKSPFKHLQGKEEAMRKLKLILTPISKVEYPGGPRGPIAKWIISRMNMNCLLSLFESLVCQNLISFTNYYITDTKLSVSLRISPNFDNLSFPSSSSIKRNEMNME
ncbi:hypothetical protein Ciccas_004150 [Cichlidogyrus casuarinus]|uniref:GTF3C1 extended winged-helix domain-containing protein n=1 Tax=Cichlidogyrus casuarinus TaxID=1844966 RepID=A0ABD2QD94_9PLAT